MVDMKVVSTKLTNSEWEKLLHVCNNKGVTIAEYIQELIFTKGDELLLDRSVTAELKSDNHYPTKKDEHIQGDATRTNHRKTLEEILGLKPSRKS